MWWLIAGAVIATLFVVSNLGRSSDAATASRVAHPEATSAEPGVASPTGTVKPPQLALTATDWKERWDDVRLEPTGDPAFIAALSRDAKDALLACARALPSASGTLDYTVELFAEADATGIRVAHAEASPRSHLEPFARRCVEQAFERHVDLEVAARTKLLHLNYSGQLSPP